MQAVILAAGQGVRMRPLTEGTPKPLLQLDKGTILERTIKILPREVDEVIIVIGYLADQIKKKIGDEQDGRKIKYIVQPELKGTADALSLCEPVLKEGKFLVVMADDLYSKKDLEQLIKNDLAIMAYPVDYPERFGVFKVDEKGNLIEIVEKPKNHIGNLVNTGAYVLNKKYFKYEPVEIDGGEFGLPQTLMKMAQDGEKIKIERASFWFPIGYPEDLEKARELVKSLKI
jgi:bifunctional UDP-N-acetylglucosamine pyrophosphorylase/glucosamine-1-phosphate N-acetyltransferase